MSKTHKWANVIHAFADGKEIQYRSFLGNGEWKDTESLNGVEMAQLEWRIKPESKPDIRVKLWRHDKGFRFHLTFVFDGETKEFKTVEYHDE